MTKTKTTELVTVTEENYPILAGGANVAETIRNNMAGEEVTEADLLRIKVPTGGATIWQVGDEACKELTGVLVHITRRRAYWPDRNQTGVPPTCASVDCMTGIGEPGGLCRECPNNQFGSAIKQDGTQGRGKACKEKKLLFLLREGRLLPDVVVVPGASLKAMRQWQLQLGLPYCAIVTRLTLAKAKSADGDEYAEVVPAKIADLADDIAEKLTAYAGELQSVFAAVGIDEDGGNDSDTIEV